MLVVDEYALIRTELSVQISLPNLKWDYSGSVVPAVWHVAHVVPVVSRCSDALPVGLYVGLILYSDVKYKNGFDFHKLVCVQFIHFCSIFLYSRIFWKHGSGMLNVINDHNKRI